MSHFHLGSHGHVPTSSRTQLINVRAKPRSNFSSQSSFAAGDPIVTPGVVPVQCFEPSSCCVTLRRLGTSTPQGKRSHARPRCVPRVGSCTVLYVCGPQERRYGDVSDVTGLFGRRPRGQAKAWRDCNQVYCIGVNAGVPATLSQEAPLPTRIRGANHCRPRTGFLSPTQRGLLVTPSVCVRKSQICHHGLRVETSGFKFFPSKIERKASSAPRLDCVDCACAKKDKIVKWAPPTSPLVWCCSGPAFLGVMPFARFATVPLNKPKNK
ncbi:hypothetical protein BJV78DRAFT_822450 [Lactifluus subvellereus]|nr:hypothetical protein BJV78DRAFT_822450 [Lactifluus subvellereus]